MRSVNNSQIRSACTKHFMLSHCACVVYSIAAPMTVCVKLKCLSGPIIYFFKLSATLSTDDTVRSDRDTEQRGNSSRKQMSMLLKRPTRSMPIKTTG